MLTWANEDTKGKELKKSIMNLYYLNGYIRTKNSSGNGRKRERESALKCYEK